MKSIGMVFVTIVGGFAASGLAVGQDRAIVQERPVAGANVPVAISGSLVPDEAIPNSISGPMRALERILSAPNPGARRPSPAKPGLYITMLRETWRGAFVTAPIL